MIVVLGRPALAEPRSNVEDGDRLDGLPARVAVATAATGAAVQLVGSVGDDREGDEVIIHLGRASVGHAALLRDPAGRTPMTGQDRLPAPRLDAQDVELGLQYVPAIDVLILAEPLDAEAQAAGLEAARFHSAAVVAIVPSGSKAPAGLDPSGTVLEAPDGDMAAFAQMVGRYAAALATGATASEAFATAAESTGWARSEA